MTFPTPVRPARNCPSVPFLVRHFATAKPNRIAASMRIPVTPANRALLRELRAEELAAWTQARRRQAGATEPGLRSDQ